jgi:PAS domain-containing protein
MPAFQDPDVYRDILDELQIGVSVLDLQKKIVLWSDGAEQITGYSRIDVLGHSCTDNILLHGNQNQCEMCNDNCPLMMALHDAKPGGGGEFDPPRRREKARLRPRKILARKQSMNSSAFPAL